MDAENVDFINYRESGQHNNLKNNKWEELNQELVRCNLQELSSKLGTFYINISLEINNQFNDYERTENLISQALSCCKLVDEEI